ncbi:hypothetical protein GCM10023085_56410 [Actinomadura viridis]|uniref:Uncharacterized protein n=1 Tax=Actinomadura viridis TaxID=58110 RepID=A0A931DBC5_9ACTN|nr:hypothetical protein [Actinomadura viridis]
MVVGAGVRTVVGTGVRMGVGAVVWTGVGRVAGKVACGAGAGRCGTVRPAMAGEKPARVTKAIPR